MCVCVCKGYKRQIGGLVLVVSCLSNHQMIRETDRITISQIVILLPYLSIYLCVCLCVLACAFNQPDNHERDVTQGQFQSSVQQI